MSHSRDDLVAAALRLLDDHGLADLSMRRVAGELGLQPSALYHHVSNKQQLLGLVSDALLERAFHPGPATTWDTRLVAVAAALRDALLAFRDGAELVASTIAFGLGGRAPYDALVSALDGSDVSAGQRPTAARTVLHYVLGQTLQEQTRLQADSLGALPTGVSGPAVEESDFLDGLAMVVDGVRVRAAAGSRVDEGA